MSFEAIAKELLEIAGTAKHDDTQPQHWLSTGYAPLNKIISGRYDGGIGTGRMYEIYGPSSSGKTIVATNVMIEAQKLGGFCIFVDFERAYMTELSEKLGMNVKPPHFIHLMPETWEEGMTKSMQIAERIRAKKMLKPDQPILVVTDSIAAATPKSVMEKEMDEHTMNDTTALARVTSSTLKVLCARGKQANVTFLFLNQIRLKPGVVYGDPTTTPGGGSMEFYASARVALGRKKKFEKRSDGKKSLTGQIITMKCVKSKHTRPFGECNQTFGFNEDGSGYFDTETSLVEHLTELGVIKKAGGRLEWDGKTYYLKALVEKIKADKVDLAALLPK